MITLNTLDTFTLIILASMLMTVIVATGWSLFIAKDARPVEFWTVATCFTAMICTYGTIVYFSLLGV
jgi:roadblock/LC7 domain-containing protein